MTRFTKVLNATLDPSAGKDDCHWGFSRGSGIRSNPSPHRAVATVAQEGRVIAYLFYEHEADTMPFSHFVDSVKLFHPHIGTATVMTDDMGTVSDLRSNGVAAMVQPPPDKVEAELIVPPDARLAHLQAWDALLAATACTALFEASGVCYV